jgi:parallel beta-helix repeat protein
MFMAVSLTLILTTGLVSVWLPKPPPVIPPPPPQEDPGPPKGIITIDGDTNFSDTALLKGWPGNGTHDNPIIIDGLHIDRGGEFGHCIMISNTQVSFTISNCILTGANVTYYWGMGGSLEGAGIHLQNVSNGELVNNTCYNNTGRGIYLEDSTYNTVMNNTCHINYGHGIHLVGSNYNTVVDNTCHNNLEYGIFIDRKHVDWENWEESHDNTVTNNTCYNNGLGIALSGSNHNTVVNNNCTNSNCGIQLWDSDTNTLSNNICFNNTGSGISLGTSNHNTVVNNTCSNSTASEFSDSWNLHGITLGSSHYNTVANNSCYNNSGSGVLLGTSCSNIVANNTCNNNDKGISLYNELGIWPDINVIQWAGSHSNTVENNICNNNSIGIHLVGSSYNTINSNTCNRNDIGIYLERKLWYYWRTDQMYIEESHANTVVNNICNNNRIGIYLGYGCVYSTWLVDNTYQGNTEYDLLKEIEDGEDEPDVRENLQLTGFVGWIGFITLTLLGVGWIMFKRLTKTE